MAEINAEGKQVWLRAFYGFGPEESGYIGFTRETDRDKMIEKMNDGDIVLIYGAVESLTDADLRRQALGFLEVKLERCRDTERQDESRRIWKQENGFADRWTYGIKVVRAWRIRNRVRIDTIAPIAYENKNRFERTTRAILLEPSERKLALNHPVHQVNVYGEPRIAENDLKHGVMKNILKPSQGISPNYGSREARYEDGENHLYLMKFTGDAEVLLGAAGDHVGKTLVKIGRSNDPTR